MAEAVSAGATVDVTVRSLAAGGSGVGDLPDGRVVFVPRTAPGDRVRIRIEKSKSRWALGSLDGILEPGPGRRDPLCALYAKCGGCQLQHLPYPEQLTWKGRFVADALERVGGLGPVPAPEVVPSPQEVGYRSRMTFTLRRLRGGRVVAGLHALGRPAHVVDVAGECVLAPDDVMRAWERLRASWGPSARLLPSAGRLRLTLRSGARGVTLHVVGGMPSWNAGPLVERMPELVAVLQTGTGETRPRVLHGPDEAALETAFEQVNGPAADELTRHVREVVGEGEALVDAYCGVGVFGRALAADGWQVRGIELDPEAVARARVDAPTGFSVEQGRVEELLTTVLPTDVLLVNPPRTGLESTVPETIRAAPPRRIVYVSCDPATLARDLRAIGPGHALESVRAFDLFPQTAHVETVAVLDLVERTT